MQQKAIEDWNKATNATRLAEVAIKDDLIANLEYINSLLASGSKQEKKLQVKDPAYGKKKIVHAEALKDARERYCKTAMGKNCESFLENPTCKAKSKQAVDEELNSISSIL